MRGFAAGNLEKGRGRLVARRSLLFVWLYVTFGWEVAHVYGLLSGKQPLDSFAVDEEVRDLPQKEIVLTCPPRRCDGSEGLMIGIIVVGADS